MELDTLINYITIKQITICDSRPKLQQTGLMYFIANNNLILSLFLKSTINLVFFTKKIWSFQ